MTGSTISTSETTGVTLGTGGLASPLTITPTGSVTYPAGIGVEGSSSGTLSLVNEGAINAGSFAVYFATIGTVINSGVIISTGTTGVLLDAGGYVSNTGTNATISGAYDGLDLIGLNSTLFNTGTIEGATGYGVYITSGTVTNNGKISGGSFAVDFSGVGDGPDVLIVGTAASFSGDVVVSPLSAAMLELESGAGTLSGIGTSFQGFTTIDFAPGADWTLKGASAGFTGDKIAGFTTHDTLDVSGLVTSLLTTVNLGSSGILIDGLLALTFSGDAGDKLTLTSDGSGGTDITLCFLAGTAIATPGGEVAIESLKIGDSVLTADGRIVPVRWIGIRTIATRFADKLRSLPIRIQAGALADNLPAHDLLVSPDHALFLGGVLVQAGALVNGVSITREAAMPETFTYYHVEVAGHALILAEGAATETFVDNVARMAFDNWAEHEALYGDAPAIAELPYPRAKSARQLPLALRRELAARAGVALAA